MSNQRILCVAIGVAACGLGLAAERGVAGELAVVSTTPKARSLDAPVGGGITVRFDQAVDRGSFVSRRSFWAFGRWSGAVDGTFLFSDSDKSVTLKPDRRLSAGEQVMVVLSHDLTSATGQPLRSGGYSFQFWTNARTASLAWNQIDSMTTRTVPQQTTRVYGGFATDLDRDGFLDITTVNEDSADLRVFLNKGDRTGLFHDFNQPPSPVNDRCSPYEPTDFNADGIADACVANINTATISIVLGVGDGTFLPQQQVVVAGNPRGIAVLDVDGDGDVDIVNTNATGNNLSLLINDGNGVFGAPTFFEGGGLSEWALAAEDMNGDGLLDLVVGARSSQLIVVHTGNGDGTFTQRPGQSSDGSTWMIATGDVNGDGNADVACANSAQNRGSILFGNGNGTLAAPVRYAADPFPLATDLGDVDGDGDLDWLNSSFSGDWWLYINDGAGGFTHTTTFAAPVAASDALLFDIDNDGDLDLGLMDELADVVIIEKNSGTANSPGDLDGDCLVNLTDFTAFTGCIQGPGVCTGVGCYVVDFDDDCDVDFADFGRFQIAFTGNDSIPNCQP